MPASARRRLTGNLPSQSVIIEADTTAPVESSGAGALSARSAFVIAANADFILSVTVENTGKGTVSPANTSFVLYRSDDKATLEAIGDVVGTYAVGAVAAESERVITQVITDATLSTDSTKPTRFVVEGQFDRAKPMSLTATTTQCPTIIVALRCTQTSAAVSSMTRNSSPAPKLSPSLTTIGRQPPSLAHQRQ